MKRFVALLLAVLLTGVFTFTAVAEEVIMPRASEYFSSYSIAITPKAGGKLSVRFSTTGAEESSILGIAVFQLQKKVDGVFQNVGEEQTGSIGNNVAEHTFTRTCQGVPGEIYRVKASFVCQNSKGYKTQAAYSSSAKAID